MTDALTMQHSEQPDRQKPRRPHPGWRCVKWLCIALGLCLVLVCASVPAALWWLRTDSAHTFIVNKANPLLAEALAPQGLRAKITRLDGKLPLNAVVGLTVADRDGVWLSLPEVRLDIDWSWAERTIVVRELVCVAPALLRLPQLPPAQDTPEPPAPPASLAPEELRATLQQAGQSLFELPSWLPTLVVENIAIERAQVADAILGVGLTANFGLSAQFAPATPQASLRLSALDIDSDIVRLRTRCEWASLPRATDLPAWLDGPLAASLAVQITPPATPPQQGLLASVLASLPPELVQALLQASQSDKAGADKTGPLSLNLELTGSPLAPELHLELAALGLEGTVRTSASLPRDNWAALPRFAADVALGMARWDGIAPFIPGQTLSGSVAVAAHTDNADGPLNASLKLDIPQFAMHGANAVTIDQLAANIALDDALGAARLNSSLAVRNVAAAGLRLGSTLTLGGPLAGLVAELTGTGGATAEPVTLALDIHGDATGKVRASWQPGQVTVPVCEVRLPSRLVMPEDKSGTTLGLVAKPGANVSYGASGLAVRNVDIHLLPAGRISAAGVLAPDKLDMHLDVRELALAKWLALVPALHRDGPKGVVDVTARLAGTPQRPGGTFRVTAKGLDVPGLPLKPFDVAVHGAIAQHLDVKLDLPRPTLSAIGADSLHCEARVPLVFAANGVPTPDMKGPLAARVALRGALAPLWALVPQADRRLQGRYDINLTAGGHMNAPTFKGTIKLDQGRFEDVALGAILQGMGLTLAVDGRMEPHAKHDGQANVAGSVRLAFGASDGMGGSVKLDGHSQLDGTGLDLRATLDHLRPLRRPDVRVALSGEARVTGEATAPEVRGNIVVNTAAIMLDNLATGASSVTTLPITEGPRPTAQTKIKNGTGGTRAKNGGKARPATTAAATQHSHAKKAAPTGKQGSLHLDITTPGRIVVDGRGLVSEWRTEMQVRGTPQEPIISGGLRSIKGKLDFMNKQFELTRGNVTFAGGSLANPLLDLFLTNSAGGFTSHIAITGTAQKMALDLSSEPPMPRDEVLSHILFGRDVNELGRLETLQLAQAMAQLAGFGGGGGGTLDFTRKALGVDVMRVNSGSGADSQGKGGGVGNMSVETGKYLTDDIYVGIEQGAKEGSTAATIELELTPRTKVQLRSEQNNTGGILNWKMNY